ncbi:MAG: hypothetical protein R3D57_13635 [Hyphomicrobiaceae bacterium]
MQSAIIAAAVAIALVTWLPDAARTVKRSMLEISAELNVANGGARTVIAEN